MDSEKVLTFGGHRLWCTTGRDVEAASRALARREVDGIFVSPHRGFVGESLDFLQDIEGLSVLAVDGAPRVDVGAISAMKSLEYLSIAEAKGRIEFSGLPRLRHLRLQWAKGRELPAEGLNKLQHLAVWGLKHTDCSFLSGYGALESLEITKAASLASLEGIGACSRLTRLVLAYCPALHDIDALAELGRLEDLELESTKKIGRYDALGKLGRLHKLIVDKSSPIVDLKPFGKLKQLRHLAIHGTAIESKDLSPLESLTQLSHVSIDGKKEYAQALGELKKAAQARAQATKP